MLGEDFGEAFGRLGELWGDFGEARWESLGKEEDRFGKLWGDFGELWGGQMVQQWVKMEP